MIVWGIQVAVVCLLFICITQQALASLPSDSTAIKRIVKDTLYIYEVEDKKEPDKVLHAEPLFIDLIRDLGARKGEAEWNIGVGLTDQNSVDQYSLLVEYEFAPINRLGVEFEIPFTFYSNRPNAMESLSDRIESLKAAVQWSFFVSEDISTSIALGYINELKFSDLNVISRAPLFKSNVYNPFLIAAKRWGNNFHTLIYAGAKLEQVFKSDALKRKVEWHTNLHYMISGTRNFIGLEMNKEIVDGKFNMVLRPQMRLGIADNVLVGIVIGIPLNRESERLSTFLRFIYEPPH